MESHKSDIVLSLKGRDKGMLLLVIDEDGENLYLANGRQRRAENPKRKKRRHVSHQGICDAWTREKLLRTGRLSNSDIRKALALWTGEAGSV